MSSQPPRILCVDDQPEMLMLLDHFLTDSGFSVATSANSHEALRIAAGEQFSAAVLDYAMPGLNGEQLANRLRELQPEMKLIVFTGSTQDLPDSIFAIVDATLSKTFPIVNLATVLQKLTGLPQRQRRAAQRYPVEAAVSVVGTMDAEIRALDICQGGIGLNKPLNSPVGSELEIVVVSPAGELLLATIAEVRHVSSGRTGLALTHVSEQQREALAAFCTSAESLPS